MVGVQPATKPSASLSLADVVQTARTAPNTIGAVWFEELCDPIAFWQVIYTSPNPDALEAIRQFYQTYGGNHQQCAGIMYGKTHSWLTEYSTKQINTICERFGHEPVFNIPGTPC